MGIPGVELNKYSLGAGTSGPGFDPPQIPLPDNVTADTIFKLDIFVGITRYDVLLYDNETSQSLASFNDLLFNSPTLMNSGIIGFHINDEAFFQFVEITGEPVPEPGTVLLFGAGIAGLAGMQQRRKENYIFRNRFLWLLRKLSYKSRFLST